MIKFAIRRLLVIIPTALMTIVLVFLLIRTIEPEPIPVDLDEDFQTSYSFEAQLQSLNRKAEQRNFHLPIFYFGVLPWDVPKNNNRNFSDQRIIKKLLNQGHHFLQIEDCLTCASQFDPKYYQELLVLGSETKTSVDHPCHNFHVNMRKSQRSVFRFLPRITWFGSRNQFHQWFSSILSMDFGTSIIDGRSINSKLAEALKWTLFLNVISLILIYSIGVPLGALGALHAGKIWERALSLVLFAFYAVPVFWLATILIVFFTSTQYGSLFHWFQHVGMWTAGGTNMIAKAMNNSGQLSIALICMVIPSLAYLSRQTKVSFQQQLIKPYVEAARLRGEKERTILWKYVFKNASFPIITLLASFLPRLISGSLILEVICNIPGMGRLLYNSIFDGDWNVILAVTFLTAILTTIGILISDLLYGWADPKARLQS